MVRTMLFVAVLVVLAFVPLSCESPAVRVGSKKFTESVVLGELAAHLVRHSGEDVVHLPELGGTRLVFEALRVGDIDIYPEYTGTLTQEVLVGEEIANEEQLRAALAERGIAMTRPLGFNNTYALGMKSGRAAELGIETASDLRRHPELTLRFSNEFMDRADGWQGLAARYGFAHRDVRGIDHDVAYRQLEAGAVDVIDVYSTDAKIAYYDLTVLEDDRNYFPRYDAVLLYREDFATRYPQIAESLRKLEGTIGSRKMIRMNARVELDGIPEAVAAGDFLAEEQGIEVTVDSPSMASRIAKHTWEHLDMVRKSLVAAILVAIPLGVLAYKLPSWGHGILAVVGIIQTIPALALLVMLIPPVSALNLTSIGSGSATAVIALFLYSLLPIVRNTHSGLHGIPAGLRESAAALGLPPLSQLWLIELPMASRTILAGIKTAAVINVGFATLGALIGAGGYGQPILTGIRLNSHRLILEGAVPAAVLALMVQGLFDLAERRFVPLGLRLKSE